ncbi:GNAT family N-acetyltransferase [Streptomyces sp. NPDC001922]|uniref:GNAT family N-acetyltransferase n=1 Tax=Streptomyces sp. NPDC001922 TaxID=3364624 RepID=UPI003688CEA9
MTTTLRPTGPEQHGPDGLRARGYEVCVNGRPVGTVRLSTDERFGPSVGRIRELRVDEPDWRRGRATVAALAAEEVLRGWGCRRAEVSVPADAGAAVALAAALGYTERNRGMVKQLPEQPPSLPDGSAARPMSAAEYPAWREAGKRGYAEEWIARGVPAEQAWAKSEADETALLPDGLDTAGAVVRVLSHRGTDVGTLWISLGERLPDGTDAFVFDVEVAAEHRGQGHGRSLMLLAERECRAAGAARLGLNVFVDNTPALRLYESLGYAPTGHHLTKTLL